MTREILPVIFKIVDSRQSGKGTYIVGILSVQTDRLYITNSILRQSLNPLKVTKLLQGEIMIGSFLSFMGYFHSFGKQQQQVKTLVRKEKEKSENHFHVVHSAEVFINYKTLKNQNMPNNEKKFQLTQNLFTTDGLISSFSYTLQNVL